MRILAKQNKTRRFKMTLDEHHEIISEKERVIEYILKEIPDEYHEDISKILYHKSILDFHFREARANGSLIQNKGGYENGSYKLPCLMTYAEIMARARDIYYASPESEECPWVGTNSSDMKIYYDKAKKELGIK